MNVGFTGILALIFITLKLTNFIDWSWWLVLLPIWGSVILTLALLLVSAVAATAGRL